VNLTDTVGDRLGVQLARRLGYRNPLTPVRLQVWRVEVLELIEDGLSIGCR
jgi:hypothetical protein